MAGTARRVVADPDYVAVGTPTTDQSSAVSLNRQDSAITESQRWPGSVLALVAYGVVLTAWYLVGLPAGFGRLLVADFLFLVTYGFAGVLCFRTARHLGRSWLALSWRGVPRVVRGPAGLERLRSLVVRPRTVSIVC